MSAARWEQDTTVRQEVLRLLAECREDQCVSLSYWLDGEPMGAPAIVLLEPMKLCIDEGQLRKNAGVPGVRYVLETTHPEDEGAVVVHAVAMLRRGPTYGHA